LGAISICRFEWQVVTDEVVLLQRALSTGSLRADPDSGDKATSQTPSPCGLCRTAFSTSDDGRIHGSCTIRDGRILGTDTLLDELRTWVNGLERIGDAKQVLSLLVKNEVSMANLDSFTVDELSSTGIGEAAAYELLTQPREQLVGAGQLANMKATSDANQQVRVTSRCCVTELTCQRNTAKRGALQQIFATRCSAKLMPALHSGIF
jgi:hypothetical protein